VKNKVPDYIIERAAELWCRALRKPKFDMGADSFNGVMSQVMAGMVAEHAQKSTSDLDARIDAFGVALANNLKFLRDVEDRKAIPEGREKYFTYDLYTDYAPNQVLRDAAADSGILIDLFPWKSSVRMSVCVGYLMSQLALGTGHLRQSIIVYQTVDGSSVNCPVKICLRSSN